MNETLNKLKQLIAQYKALQDPKTIELIIKQQVQYIRDEFKEIVKDHDKYMAELNQIEQTLIKKYVGK